MKKFVAFFIVLALSSFVLTGCSASKVSPADPDSDFIEAESPSPDNPLDLIVGKYVGVFEANENSEKGVTFDISEGTDGTYIATETTYAIAKYADMNSATYSCDVTYQDGYYSIKELSKDSDETNMTYYRLTLDGDVLQGDNVSYTDGSVIGKIAVERAETFDDLVGTYEGIITGSDETTIGLDIVIQQARDGTYEALCSFSPTDTNPDVTPSKELCLVTYYYGGFYLMGKSWVIDPGQTSLIDFEVASPDELAGTVWTDSQAVGVFTAQ